MLYAAGKPIIHHLLLEAKKAGITEAVIIVRHMKDKLIAYLSGLEMGIQLKFVEQKEDNVTGAALLCAPVAVATPAPQIRLVLGGAEYAWVERLSPLTSLPVVRRYLTPNRDIGAGFFPGSTGVLIDYPASLFAFGTAREHIEIGADNLDAAIKARPGPLAGRTVGRHRAAPLEPAAGMAAGRGVHLRRCRDRQRGRVA